MDFYFEVGELEFPKGAAAKWLAQVLEETDRDEEDRRTVEGLFETLEGDVDVKRTADFVRARIMLIDGAFFQDQDALALALDAAAKFGAKGKWFSGSEQSGEQSTFERGRRKVIDVDAQAFWPWLTEASKVREPKKAKKKKK